MEVRGKEEGKKDNKSEGFERSPRCICKIIKRENKKIRKKGLRDALQAILSKTEPHIMITEKSTL